MVRDPGGSRQGMPWLWRDNVVMANFGIVQQNGIEDGGVDRQPQCCNLKD